MRPSVRWCLCLGLLVGLGAALPARAAEDGRAAAGRQLARTARALAATAQAAKAPQAGLPRGGPFRAALDRLAGALGRADAGLRAGDARYFAALSDGSRALAELEVVWARTPRRDPAVAARVSALSAAYRRLRNGYGWEALRRGQGALTAPETRRFHALQKADAQLAARLKPVQAKVAKAGDRAMADQVKRLREQAQRIATAELTLEAYLTAELLNDIVQGEWAASQHYVAKPYRAVWKKSAPAIEKLATDSSIGFVFAADLSKAEAWRFDDSGDAGEEAAAADREAAASAPAKAAPAPARDETPVDEVEIVDGKPQRTEGVAPEEETSADPGAPAAGEAAPQTTGDATTPATGEAAPTAPGASAPPATGETAAPPSAPAAEPSPAPAGEASSPASTPAAEPAPPATGDAAPPASTPAAPDSPTAAPAPPAASAGEPAAPAPPAAAAAPPSSEPPADAPLGAAAEPAEPAEPGNVPWPPAVEPAAGDPGASEEMAPQDPDAVPALSDAEPPPSSPPSPPPPEAQPDQPDVQPPSDAPGDPGIAPPPADPNAPEATPPDQSPPSEDEPLPAEPPPPPPPPPIERSI